MSDNERLCDLLIKWHYRFNKSEKSHYRSATSCRIFNYSLGIPLVIITVIVASDIFGLLEKAAQMQYPWQADKNMELEASIVAILSVMAPVLAALQTFLRFPERAEQHRNAAVKFGVLKTEVERQITFPPSDKVEIEKVLNNIQEKDSQIMSESPSIGSLSLIRSGFDVKPMNRAQIVSEHLSGNQA